CHPRRSSIRVRANRGRPPSSSLADVKAMNFDTELAWVAETYRAEGYQVTLRPGPGDLPPFAAGFRIDLLAAKGTERVLVQVKVDREELQKDPDSGRVVACESTTGKTHDSSRTRKRLRGRC